MMSITTAMMNTLAASAKLYSAAIALKAKNMIVIFLTVSRIGRFLPIGFGLLSIHYSFDSFVLYISNAEAIATFSDSAFPNIGIVTTASASSMTSLETP